MRTEIKVALAGVVLIAVGAMLQPYATQEVTVLERSERIIPMPHVVEIPPGRSIDVEFGVPSGARDPYLEVRLMVVAGGNRDVDLVVLNAAGQALYSERIREYAERSIPLPGPGKYILRLDNTFSIVTKKTVEAEAKLVYNTERIEVRYSDIPGVLTWLGAALIVAALAIAAAKTIYYSAREFKRGLRGE